MVEVRAYHSSDHINRKHVRRYICLVCQPTIGFNLQADLTRLNRAKHDGGEGEVFYCAEPGCKEPNKPWARKDNLNRHMKRCQKAVAKSARC